MGRQASPAFDARTVRGVMRWHGGQSRQAGGSARVLFGTEMPSLERDGVFLMPGFVFMLVFSFRAQVWPSRVFRLTCLRSGGGAGGDGGTASGGGGGDGCALIVTSSVASPWLFPPCSCSMNRPGGEV
jgi:hypothetical protein